MATELNHSDGDRLAETRRLLDELDVELKDLGGDCIKVMQLMQLLKADSSLLKDRALAVLHLGVSRGCIEIVDQVVKFYEGEDSLGDGSERGLQDDSQQTTRAREDGSKASSGTKGEDILGDRSETEEQGVKASREEEIHPLSGNEDVSTVALDERQTQIHNKNETSDPGPSHPQDDSRGTSRHFSKFKLNLRVRQIRRRLEFNSVDDEIDARPVVDFGKLLRAKYLYSGAACELDALEVAVVNGNLDVLALLLTRTLSFAVRELPRNQLRETTERVLETIRGHSLSRESCQNVFDAWRNDREFNFLFWDFGLGQERVSEYLFHFLFTHRNRAEAGSDLREYLWGEVWDYQGEPWEEPLWKSLLKLHDAQGRTPLHVAVDEETVGDFHFLLRQLRLADRVEVFAFAMEATDGLGRTPLHRALLRCNETKSAFHLTNLHENVVSDWMDGFNVPLVPRIYNLREVSLKWLWQQHTMEDPVSRLERRGILGLSLPGYDIKQGFTRSRKLSETTRFHSALLQGRNTSYLREDISDITSALSPRDTHFRCSVEGLAFFKITQIDALELATLTGDVEAVKQLLLSAEKGPLKTAYTREQSLEWGRINRYGWVVGDKDCDELNEYVPRPTIHIAAYFGNYEMLKVFIDSKICDTYIEDEKGRTVLHAVLNPKKITIKGDLIDFANVKHIPPNYVHVGPPPYESSIVERQGCINLLLQSGCDIFKVDRNGQAPYPKGSLSKEKDFLSWWYERQLKEFNSNQNTMSFATNMQFLSWQH